MMVLCMIAMIDLQTKVNCNRGTAVKSSVKITTGWVEGLLRIVLHFLSSFDTSERLCFVIF